MDEIVKRMDFPLVAIALSYDGFTNFDTRPIEEFCKALPEPGYLFNEFEKRSLGDSESSAPTAPGQLVKRNATNTKLGYEGRGFAKKLTYHLTDEARREGFRSLIVNCVHPAVTHIMLNTPCPASARVLAAFESDDIVDKDGKAVYEGIKHTMSLIVVDLN